MKAIKFLLMLVTPLLFHSAFAQDASFGLKGGLNIATIGGDAEGVSSKAGIHFGAFSRMEVSESLIFQPELIYSMQGSALDGTGDPKANYSYLNIPMIFRIYPNNEGFHIHAGPQIGFLLSGEISAADVDIDVKNQLNSIDFALGLGMGYDINNIILDARYNLGINSSAEDDTEGSFPLRTLQLSIGFIF